MSHVVKNGICSLARNCFFQQVRFYPRWSHRRPIKVYSPEEYEMLEEKQTNKSTSKLKTKQNDFKDAPWQDHIKDDFKQNDIKDAFRQDDIKDAPKFYDRKYASRLNKYAKEKISWAHSKENKMSEPLQYHIKPKNVERPLVATNQKAKVVPVDMLETVIDSDGNYIYTKIKDHDVRISMLLTEIKSKKVREKNDLILLEGKRLIKDALLAGCKLEYILFSRKKEVEYVKPFLPKFGARLYKISYGEIQLWSDLITSPGIMGIFKTPDTEAFRTEEALPLTIICDNVREPGNLGAILRICAGVGCAKVILTKGCVDLWDTKVLRSSMGGHFKLQILKDVDWEKLDTHINPSAKFYVADNKTVSSTSDEEEQDQETSKVDLKQILHNMTVVPYYGVDFKNSEHIVLIVGGETFGISENSYEMAFKRNGARLHVPLSNDIESLNVGAALGVIAFEVKRQLSCS